MEQKAEDIIDAVPMALVLIGPDKRIAKANARAEEIFGRGLAGRHYIVAFRAPAILEAAEAVLDGRSDRAQSLFQASDASGDTVWQVTATRLGRDARISVLVSFEDTTALREAGQIRRDFVANVSHELRTPLTALIGFIETLRGAARDDPAARERFLGVMEREANRMNRLVRDLLSLSRVESEERLRPTAPVDLAAVVRSVVLSLKPVAEDAQVRITVDGAGAESIVPGDADQLAQVLTNLVENAVKYSGRGCSVTVSVRQEPHEPSLRTPAVIVSVSDDGEGVDPVHIPRLTERFYRVDSHRSREMGGTGLGLAIVKHIVNRHRGRLRIESAPGKGSRFTVILPAQGPQAVS